MSYRLTPHLDTLFGRPAGRDTGDIPSGAVGPAACWFALLDVGPFVPVARPLERLLARHPGKLLFEPTASAEALAYSPRLIELGPSRPLARQQAESLDATCGHLPALSLLTGALGLPALLERLRFLMWVDTDDTPFLLRVADTPSMRAVAAVLTVRQRAEVFAGLQGWWCVDHAGRLHNLVAADGSAEPGPGDDMRPGEPIAPRFTLDAAQTTGVVRGTAVPMLAAQIRTADPSFGERLSHAEQAQFASDLLDEARLEAYEEAELLGIARARWQGMQVQGSHDDV